MRAEGKGKYVFQLYVAGTTPKSTEAIAGVKRILETQLGGMYTLEVIDIYQQPFLARDAHVMVVPTLVRVHPPSLRKIVGRSWSKPFALTGLDLQRG